VGTSTSLRLSKNPSSVVGATKNEIAIRVENLSKQYCIGGPKASYKTLRESLTDAATALFRRLSSIVRRLQRDHLGAKGEISHEFHELPEEKKRN
jgi:hypothetical protein